jgi:acetoacetyl-CoA synthetase
MNSSWNDFFFGYLSRCLLKAPGLARRRDHSEPPGDPPATPSRWTTKSGPEPIYQPNGAQIARSQITGFARYCEAKTARTFPDYDCLHRFSVEEFPEFWRLYLEWSEITWEGDPEPVCTHASCEEATFFPNLRLNYTENLLAPQGHEHADHPAITSVHDNGAIERLTRGELRRRVLRLMGALRETGVKPGDRVAAICHNSAEAVIAGLAVAGLGASFSTSSPDMGAFAIVSRFRRLEPTLLICNLHDSYEGVRGQLHERIAEIVGSLPSLLAVIALDDGPVPASLPVACFKLAEMLDRPDDGAVEWRRFPFNHPLFILFSSGTTGPPKCIVHGAGGTLLEHSKEHRLHGDLSARDKLFFQTSCGWMMWNWQLSALASGAEIVLYDGPVGEPGTLWRIVSQEHVTVFGTSPSFLQYCADAGFHPAEHFPVPALRAILSTGSILFERQYDWVKECVKPLPLQSISGGTDIIGCFVLGNPNLPVYRGEIQCKSLGLDVQAWREDGVARPGEIGELVCEKPFPSRPLGFYGDQSSERFHRAYFAQNDGMWTHGDFVEFTARGTARMHGRSDGVLNIRGIRIGPAEIYRILQDLPEIQEAMAIEQVVRSGPEVSRLVLLLVLRKGLVLDQGLTLRVKRELSRRGSPAHVPAVIAQVDELPVTYSGKRSERAAYNALNGWRINNVEALRNPRCLEVLKEHPALQLSAAAV